LENFSAHSSAQNFFCKQCKNFPTVAERRVACREKVSERRIARSQKNSERRVACVKKFRNVALPAVKKIPRQSFD